LVARAFGSLGNVFRTKGLRWLLPALLLGAVILAAGESGRLEAHALLVRADPPVNAQLREPPTVLTLYFSEPLERRFSNVRVVNQQGTRVDDRVEFDDADPALMRVHLKAVEPGYLSVNWENVSSVDGHRISGAYPLTILNADGSTPAGTPIEAGASVAGEDPDPFRVFAKFALLIAGCLLVGALAFVAHVTPGLRGDGASEARSTFERISLRVAAVAIVVLVVAGLIELATQSADISASIGDVLDTRWGERWLLRNLVLIQPALLVGALLLGLKNRRLLAYCALIGAAGYLAITSSVSHGAAGGGSFWAVASDFVHLLATSVWLGMLGLLILLLLWARKHMQAGTRYFVIASALQRFSVLAVISVALLLFTGTVNSIIEVGKAGDLLNTGYGRALLAKLLLLLPLLGIAASNAYLIRPDLVEATENTGVRNRTAVLADLEGQLNNRMRLELGVAVLVLAVVALLVQLTPTRGRVEPSGTRGTAILTAEGGGIQTTLRVDPNEPGDNTFEVYLAGQVDIVESMRLEFVQPDGFSGQSRLDLEPSRPPVFYIGQGPFLSSPGDWSIILNIRVITGNDLRLSYNLDVPDPLGVRSAPRTGGSFGSPIPFSATTVALLVLSGAVSLGVVVGSVRRPGLPEGYLGWLTAEIAYRAAPFNVRPVWTLGALVVMGLVLGYVISNHLHEDPLTPQQASLNNPVPASAESIARGRVLFQNNCTICHGESGKGDGPAAATLQIPPANLYDHIPYHPDTFFFNVISKGVRPVMPAFEGQISEEDRWNILNYLRATFTATPALQ